MMTTSKAKKDALTNLIVNVLDFQSGNTMEAEMTECGYDKIDNLATMYKYELMALKYSKSSINTPFSMNPRRNCYNFFGGEITLCL